MAGNVDNYLKYSNDFMAYSKAVGMASGSLNGVASDVGLHAGPLFSLYMNGGELPGQSLIGDTFTNTTGSNGSTGTNTNGTTNGTTTNGTTTNGTTTNGTTTTDGTTNGTTTNGTTTNGTTTNGTTNGASTGTTNPYGTGTTTNGTTSGSGVDSISNAYAKQCEDSIAEVKDILASANINMPDGTKTSSDVKDEFGNTLAVDEKGNKYDPERIKAVQDILDSEAKQIEFERLAKHMDSAIEGESNERDKHGFRLDFWNIGSDTDKEKQWQKDSAAMEEAISKMDEKEYAAFSKYYEDRSKALTGTATTPAMALAKTDKDGRDIISPELVDKIAAKGDKANKWLKELPEGETEATKTAREKEEAETGKETQRQVRVLTNKMEDLLTDAATARAMGDENSALKLEGEAAKMQNDIADLQAE